jgi:hypothetical protein
MKRVFLIGRWLSATGIKKIRMSWSLTSRLIPSALRHPNEPFSFISPTKHESQGWVEVIRDVRLNYFLQLQNYRFKMLYNKTHRFNSVVVPPLINIIVERARIHLSICNWKLNYTAFAKTAKYQKNRLVFSTNFKKQI